MDTKLAPSTRMGPVALTVADLDTIGAFYAEVIGLAPLVLESSRAVYGVDAEPLVELHEERGAQRAPQRSTGLYHLAILFPSRGDLGAALRRLVEHGWPVDGASDHLVSEAIYLRDPEGNGIELYRDRPREEWPRENGSVRMANAPLDLQALLDEAGTASADVAPAGTTMGHVHLKVADLGQAEAFYCGVLGFEMSVDWSNHGALFVSAGGYHHHLGLNIWESRGGAAPAPGSAGLRSITLLVPSDDELAALAARAQAPGTSMTRNGATLQLTDPFGISVRVARDPAA